ncbi:MAG: PolC-type DNA polymerase III [Povalibacter sp.]
MAKSLVVVTFETSGKAPEQGGRITEVAAVRIHNGEIIKRYTSLANSGVRLRRPLIESTGITQQMVDSAPPMSAVMDRLLAFIGSDPVIAHNATFDQRMFDTECEHAGVQIAIEPFICFLRLARRLFPELESHSLGTLSAALGIYYPGGAQRAATAAEVAGTLVIQFCQTLRARLRGVEPDAALLRQISEMPAKHARAMLEYVPDRTRPIGEIALPH